MESQIIAITIFAVTLVAMFTEVFHRVVVTALGASIMVGAGHLFDFYDEEIAIDAVEFETLGLLMGMMIIVVLLQHTGFFEYVAIRVAQYSDGDVARLLLLLGISTSILSMFLDNVTTVVLMAPVVILIADVLGVSPIPLLISQAIFSNTGGMATMVGDPPNILIGAASGLTFNDFVTRMAPIVFVVWLLSYAILRFLFRNDLPDCDDREALLGIDARSKLKDPKSARRVLIVLAGIVVMFFLESTLGIPPAYSAMTGAAVALAWTHDNIHTVLEEVEWDVLLFFVSLFVMVGGLEQAGVMESIADSIKSLEDVSLVTMGLVIMWAMVILSALVDNVPITVAVIPIVLELEREGINVVPLWWAIALGAGLGGNATPIGSTANVVVISASERTENPITNQQWLKEGLPTVVLTTIVASGLYILLFDYLANL